MDITVLDVITEVTINGKLLSYTSPKIRTSIGLLIECSFNEDTIL